MKLLKFVFILFAIHSGYMVQQCNMNDKEVIDMLKEFYIAHSTIWSISSSNTSSGFLNKKLDSLAEKYCTTQLRAEAKRYLKEGGYDLMTDDWGMSKESLTSMTVLKDTKENTYVVSYIVDSYPVAPSKPVKKQVILHVTVIKVRDIYKIASVK